jgi:threonylcarbamoyladenosine tRNA methylthiotransferase MtaB
MVRAGEVRDVNTFTASFSFGDRTRSFLKVQDGCDYKCSFCTIPHGPRRQPFRHSRKRCGQCPPDCQMGTREIVLTGVNLGDFGNGTAVIEGERPKKRRCSPTWWWHLDEVEEVAVSASAASNPIC